MHKHLTVLLTPAGAFASAARAVTINWSPVGNSGNVFLSARIAGIPSLDWLQVRSKW